MRALLLAVTAAGLLAVPAGAQEPGPEPVAFTAMAANVGNVSPWCAEQVFKLCHLAVEERIAERLAIHDVDLLGLTEVLPPELCDDATVSAGSPFNACSLASQEPPQVVRLLGEGYTVACVDAVAWDCLALKSDIGEIDGCPAGYCGPVLETWTAPDGCDQGFQTFGARVTVRGVPLYVIVAHPDSMDVECRRASISDLFARVPAGVETLVLGDMNLDPYRSDDASVQVWDAHVGEGRPFAYLSGIAEHDPPYYTLVPMESQALDPTGELTDGIALEREEALAGTVDHVVATRGLTGGCVTLGEAPGTERLDGGGGMDHRALLCDVATAVAPPAAQTEPPSPQPLPTLPATGGGVIGLGALGLVLVTLRR